MGVFIAGLLATLLSVGTHYEALILAVPAVEREAIPKRLRVVIGVLIALLAHALEATIFALFWWGLLESGAVTFEPPHLVQDFSDALYFSFACYTSLGFGDIVASGPARILSGFEALVGLVLIAWTASFTYFLMARDWDR